jgi:hypothetical protein
MSDQDNSTRLDDRDEQGSGLLRSVELAGYSMSASGADGSDETGGSDSNKDLLGSGDADSSDASDADGTDGEGSDADGTDTGADSDSSDATADADGTDA